MRIIKLLLAFCFSIAIASCGGGGGGGGGGGAAADITPPTVLSTSPVNSSTGVVVYTPITVRFSEPMLASTITTATFTMNNGVTGVVTKSGTTATFTPTSYLAGSTTYTATITTAVKDVAGNALASAYTWTFTTGAALVAPTDPLYVDQWHLRNTGQLGATGVAGLAGQDMNVESVWGTYKGSGIRIAVVDDGLEIAHEDLTDNMAAGLSYDYVGLDTNPDSGTHGHGTKVAGIAGARDNTLGGRGVAPRANMVGYNLLQNSTASNEADAMTRGSPNVHINTNSWGPPDGNGTLDASDSSWRTAITAGLTSGRNGLGTIYTWAAGNGAPDDNSNYDGYANNRGVIAVAAVNDQGFKSSYSEPGANLWVSTPGGEFCSTHTITTTDRTGEAGSNLTTTGPADYPNRNYTKCMNGTSAAAPSAAGAIALVLEANPALGWRDVRLILAQSARKNDPADTGWTTSTTTPSYNFNHKYGFGVIDTQAAVTLASTWINVGSEVTFTTALASPNLAIPDNNATGVSNTINVAGSGITNIEFIEITFSAANHTYSGALEITLTSPAGKISRLAELHLCANNVCTAHNGWVFGSARHLGEAVNGNWTLKVADRDAFGDTGTFQSWRLKFYGR